MGTYYYDTKKGLIQGACALVLLGFFGWRFMGENGGFIDLLMMIISLLGLASLSFGVLQKDPAIEWDRTGVSLCHFLGKSRLRWADVHGIWVKTMTFRGAQMKWLVVQRDGEWIGARYIVIPIQQLDVVAGAEERLADDMLQAWHGAVGETGLAMAGAGSAGWGAHSLAEKPAAAFNADDAFARYQARQLEEAGEPPAAPSPSMSPVPPVPPQPTTPPRPVFGRKAV